MFLKLREQDCFMKSSLLSVSCRAAACYFCDSLIYTLIRQSDNVHTHRPTVMPHLQDLIFQTIKEIKRVDYGATCVTRVFTRDSIQNRSQPILLHRSFTLLTKMTNWCHHSSGLLSRVACNGRFDFCDHNYY